MVFSGGCCACRILVLSGVCWACRIVACGSQWRLLGLQDHGSWFSVAAVGLAGSWIGSPRPVGVQLRICEEVGVSVHGKILHSASLKKHEKRIVND